MKYNFDKCADRIGVDSYKWDVKDGELPMWVADMDFETAPAVAEAIEKRLKKGALGYNIVPQRWGLAYAAWWERRHGFTPDPSNLIFVTGAVPAISSCVRKLTTPGEKVLLTTPVYNIFFNSTVNNGCTVLECPLAVTGEGNEITYGFDWEKLEEGLSDPQVRLMILCNPHNPVGRIWTRDELERLGNLCEKYAVTVISDELHCDLTNPDAGGYVPFASVSEVCRRISITCLSPSKAFNLAGLQSAAVYVDNPQLHHLVWRALNTDEVAEPNSFAVPAAIAALEEGEDWLEQLRSYLFENRTFAEKYIRENIPKIGIVHGDATYLLWLDCRRLPITDSEALTERIRELTGLILCPGAEYGRAGEGFLRVNIACSRAMVEEGLSRLRDAIDRM